MCKTSITKRAFVKKIFKIVGLLFLVHFSLYVPVPITDLKFFKSTLTCPGSNQTHKFFLRLLHDFAEKRHVRLYLGFGFLGVVPHLNVAFFTFLLTPFFPALVRLQNEEGGWGHQQLKKYKKNWTVGVSLFLSVGVAFLMVNPKSFNYFELNELFKIIVSLTLGSFFCTWAVERITQEGLGDGFSLVFLINSVSSSSTLLKRIREEFLGGKCFLENIRFFIRFFLLYFLAVSILVCYQESYKKIKLLTLIDLVGPTKGKPFGAQSYVPLKVSLSGMLPLVATSLTAPFFISFLQNINKFKNFTQESIALKSFNVLFCFLNLNAMLISSCFFAVFLLNPNKVARQLGDESYFIPEVKKGKSVSAFLEKKVTRLTFIGALFLVFLSLFPFPLAHFFKIKVYEDLNSLLFLIGTIIDLSSQAMGFLIGAQYENFQSWE